MNKQTYKLTFLPHVVIDDTMEVRRLLYSKQNIDELIK